LKLTFVSFSYLKDSTYCIGNGGIISMLNVCAVLLYINILSVYHENLRKHPCFSLRHFIEVYIMLFFWFILFVKMCVVLKALLRSSVFM